MWKKLFVRHSSPLPLWEGLGVGLFLLLAGSASLQAQDTDPFPDRTIPPRKYQMSMTCTSQVVMNGAVVTDAVVAAYCGDDFRGKESVGAGTDPNIAFLTIWGDDTGDKQYLHFRVFTQGKIFTCNPDPAFVYTFNGSVGSNSDPYIIDITPVSLANDADNTATLTTWENKTCDMALTGRTLFKDGAWNTLCLPFSLSEEQIAASDLAGATSMELDATGTYATDEQTGFDANDGTLYLYFKTASAIEAGKPYIVKWASGSDLETPVFTSVTVTSTSAGTVEAKNSGLNTVQFIGTYSPARLTPNDKSNLFLDVENKLYYPNQANNDDGNYYVNSCRAYFHVDLDGSAGVRQFVLNFGDDEVTTGISDATRLNDKGQMINDRWYTLDGRKLDGQPTKCGLYIHGGRMVVINGY